MFELTILIFLVLVLSSIQSIIGVGVLVLGTPILLILEYNMLSILSILLPISIATSLINIFLMKKKMQSIEKILSSKTKNFFYIFCLPSILIGLLLLKIFYYLINFEILISALILMSILIKRYYHNKKVYISNLKKKIVFSIVGLIHGLTNSGGTLLSLFISFSEKNFKINSRYIITFFYLILASTQLVLFLSIFWDKIFFTNTHWILISTLFGCFIGNYIIKYINENYIKLLVEITAIISSVVLFINGVN